MGRPAKKKAYWESKKAEAGKLQADLEHQKKLIKKMGIFEFIESKIVGALDRLDPMETVAIAATTYIVHGVVMDIKGIPERIDELLKKAPQTMAGTPILGKTLSTFGFVQGAGASVEDTKEIYYWALSFVIGFILVRHGGQIIGLMGDVLKSPWMGTFAMGLLAL